MLKTYVCKVTPFFLPLVLVFIVLPMRHDLLITRQTNSMKTCFSSDEVNVVETKIPRLITHQQSKAQVEYFRRALDKLGATSPEQVVEFWVEGEKSRNGVMHYAVACEELKSEYIKEWGEPSESFWVHGGSSPMVTKHELLYLKMLSNIEYEAKMKFYLFSGGTEGTSETTLLIVKDKGKWCVKEEKIN